MDPSTGPAWNDQHKDSDSTRCPRSPRSRHTYHWSNGIQADRSPALVRRPDLNDVTREWMSLWAMSRRQLTSAHVATPRAGPLDPNTPQKKRSTMRVAILRLVSPTHGRAPRQGEQRHSLLRDCGADAEHDEADLTNVVRDLPPVQLRYWREQEWSCAGPSSALSRIPCSDRKVSP
jgi:hypothetical protein